jgi:hypothetical protein
MKKLSAWMPHIVAVVIFIVLGAIYFAPQFDGYELNQSDIRQYIGMSKEISDYREMEHKEPLWTNSAFGGMPTYQISMKNPQLLSSIQGFLFFKIFKTPLAYLIIAMISFYVLLLCFGVNSWISIIGAIAFGFSSVHFIFLAGGHNSKVHAIALMPGIIGSLIYAYRKNLRVGGLLLSIFLCLQISANHIQETYYLLFLILAIIVVEAIRFYNEKAMFSFFKKSSFIALAALIGILPNISNLMLTSEYAKYSNRGESDLTIESSQNQSGAKGLNRDYITEYNFDYGEAWSLAIPNVKGGKSSVLGDFKAEMNDVPTEFQKSVSNFPCYWGGQASTGGAFYFGAVIFLLFVLGIVFIRDNLKWAFLAIAVLSITLAWKGGFMIDFFINHVPLFNKFRDTKMILTLVQIIFPLVGLVFVNQIIQQKPDGKKFLYVTGFVLGGFLLFFLTPASWFSFFSSYELDYFRKQVSQFPEAAQKIYLIQDEIKHVRIAIFRADVLRSMIFIAVAGGLIFIFIKKKIEQSFLLISLGLLILFDLWSVDKRYLNNDMENKQWVKSDVKMYPFRASIADVEILSNELVANPELKEKVKTNMEAFLKNNKSPIRIKEALRENVAFTTLNFETDYRVLALGNPFANAYTSYYHKSVGGYHAAKLKKYAELIDFQLNKEHDAIIDAINSKNDSVLRNTLENKIPCFNMLNTKYIIYNPDIVPIKNQFANSPVWLVKNIKVVENANDEIRMLDSVNPKSTVIVQQSFANMLPQNLVFDSAATIKLTHYRPNYLKYESNAGSPQLAVFSEIYYKEGWNAYVDGKLTPYSCVDYVLRGMTIPAGKHTIEYKFEPSTYTLSRKISYASSAVLMLFILGIIYWEWKENKKVKTS